MWRNILFQHLLVQTTSTFVATLAGPVRHPTFPHFRLCWHYVATFPLTIWHIFPHLLCPHFSLVLQFCSLQMYICSHTYAHEINICICGFASTFLYMLNVATRRPEARERQNSKRAVGCAAVCGVCRVGGGWRGAWAWMDGWKRGVDGWMEAKGDGASNVQMLQISCYFVVLSCCTHARLSSMVKNAPPRRHVASRSLDVGWQPAAIGTSQVSCNLSQISETESWARWMGTRRQRQATVAADF
jgi:hypothetical protein